MRHSLALLALLGAGCASLRWSGGGPPASVVEGPAAPAAQARPHEARVELPPSTEEQKRSAVFYSDLGPDSVDVSGYPLMQRRNYRVYASACSRCHGLARSINSPLVNRAWWEFYVMSMRARGSLSGRALTAEEVAAVLDFLEYDGRERKAKRPREFERAAEELKRRYAALLSERMGRLQKSPQPAILNEP